MSSVFDYIDMEIGQNKLKHVKIADGIQQAIIEGKLHTGDMLPSVNRLMVKTGVARMTVLKALDDLKKQGVIESKNRVGYFVRNERVTCQLKVMLFLTSFDSYHEVLYQEIMSGLNTEHIHADLYFHHCNPDVFRSVIKEHLGMYGLYIVTPFQHPSVKGLLSDIPKHKLLQVLRPPVLNGTSYISQRFDDELTNALLAIRDRIEKYNRFELIFQDKRGHPAEIKDAFAAFCRLINISYQIKADIEDDMIKKGTAFFTITDNDLIRIVKLAEDKGFKIGNEVGIISYNETPMKEIIRNGITVVSTDFRQIGREIRKFIETQRIIQKYIPTKVIVRNSL